MPMAGRDHYRYRVSSAGRGARWAFVMRIIVNAFIMAAEIAAVVGLAWLGYRCPLILAALTFAVAFLAGIWLEIGRLRNELSFYFGKTALGRGVLVPLIGLGEALFKALIAAVAAIFTFSGTDHDRLFWVAILFGFVVYAGSTILRTLSIRLDAIPARWGFFRLAPPLGLLFSVGIAALAHWDFVPQTTVGDLGWRIVWDLPKVPNLEQVSELFFQLKQAFDEFVVTLLAAVLPVEWARLVGLLLSVNVLTGFVASVHAAIIATAVRAMEKWNG